MPYAIRIRPMPYAIRALPFADLFLCPLQTPGTHASFRRSCNRNRYLRFPYQSGTPGYFSKFASMPLDLLEALVMAEIDLGEKAGCAKVF